MFRIDLCRFFYTPARGGICLHLLDQEIFFAPSQEPINLEQSMVTKVGTCACYICVCQTLVPNCAHFINLLPYLAIPKKTHTVLTAC